MEHKKTVEELEDEIRQLKKCLKDNVGKPKYLKKKKKLLREYKQQLEEMQ